MWIATVDFRGQGAQVRTETNSRLLKFWKEQNSATRSAPCCSTRFYSTQWNQSRKNGEGRNGESNPENENKHVASNLELWCAAYVVCSNRKGWPRGRLQSNGRDCDQFRCLQSRNERVHGEMKSLEAVKRSIHLRRTLESWTWREPPSCPRISRAACRTHADQSVTLVVCATRLVSPQLLCMSLCAKQTLCSFVKNALFADGLVCEAAGHFGKSDSSPCTGDSRWSLETEVAVM